MSTRHDCHSCTTVASRIDALAAKRWPAGGTGKIVSLADAGYATVELDLGWGSGHDSSGNVKIDTARFPDSEGPSPHLVLFCYRRLANCRQSKGIWCPATCPLPPDPVLFATFHHPLPLDRAVRNAHPHPCRRPPPNFKICKCSSIASSKSPCTASIARAPALSPVRDSYRCAPS